jgi:hypothetical protein
MAIVVAVTVIVAVEIAAAAPVDRAVTKINSHKKVRPSAKAVSLFYIGGRVALSGSEGHIETTTNLKIFY